MGDWAYGIVLNQRFSTGQRQPGSERSPNRRAGQISARPNDSGATVITIAGFRQRESAKFRERDKLTYRHATVRAPAPQGGLSGVLRFWRP